MDLLLRLERQVSLEFWPRAPGPPPGNTAQERQLSWKRLGLQHDVLLLGWLTRGKVVSSYQQPYITETGVVLSPAVSHSLRPHGLQPARLLCLWDFLGKNFGVGCRFLLQGIFLTRD